MPKRPFSLLSAALLLSLVEASSFSLLGPYETWMDEAKGFRREGDIGGPMSLNREYRWNLPTITYGFDQSFLENFGALGVQEVDKAFATLSDLPPFSDLDLNDYPLQSKGPTSFGAKSLRLMHFRSVALQALVEQLGLAQAERWTFLLRDVQVQQTSTNYVVIQRNIDPYSRLLGTNSVNGTPFTFNVSDPAYSNSSAADAVEVAIDPVSKIRTSVAEKSLMQGEYFTGLTREDVGGLKYLYEQGNRNFENLAVGGVTAIDGGTVKGNALRPGINDFNFIKMQFDRFALQFVPLTNDFLDAYIGFGGVTKTQMLRRVVTQPDIVFSAGDIGTGPTGFPRLYTATGTSNWINNANLNSIADGTGPGLIPPGVRLTFNTATESIVTIPPSTSQIIGYKWGAFNTVTVTKIFPAPDYVQPTLVATSVGNGFQISFEVDPLLNYRVDFSTNLLQWQTLTNLPPTPTPVSITDEVQRDRVFYRVAIP